MALNFSNITWLDDKGHIKPPIFLYLMLVFLARGWCVFIASLTQFSDQAGLVKLFYPEKSDFILALVSGVGAVMIYGLIIAERKRSPAWLQPIFRRLIGILWLLLVLDAIILGQRLAHDYFIFKISYALDGLILFWSALYLANSKRLMHYVKDWHPDEEMAETKTSSESSQDIDREPSVASLRSKPTARAVTSVLMQPKINQADSNKNE
ncbi:DUF2919 domain-containing protein [Shewanella denitrificans]|uniref:DUF2919 domain-containing protein n=1 Tax=Shewanella denitrificans TaxID=192073 RepID=UPI0039EF3F2D